MGKMKFGVIISGNGSNLQSLIDACKDKKYPAEIAVVISNNTDARGIGRAMDAGLSTKIIDHRNFSSRSEFDQKMTDVMVNAGVELICLAGFMRVLSREFVNHWWNNVINIHPSLLPAFKGLNAQNRALDSGTKFSGCTVHVVRSGVDDGPIISQAVVPIQAGEDGNSLKARILEQEHLLYPQVVRWIATGKVRITNDAVQIKDAVNPTLAIFNPERD